MTEEKHQSNMKKEKANASFKSLTGQTLWSRFATVKVFFPVVGVIILIAAFLFIYVRFDFVTTRLVQKTDVLQKNVEQMQVASRNFSQQLQQIHDELNKQLQNITELRRSQGQHPDQWRVSEAQYLVKLANDQLQLMRDIPLAQKLLQVAGDKIKDISDSNLENVRKAIALDIAHLQSVQQVNKEDIYLRLMALNEKIDQLPLLIQKGGLNQKQNEEQQQDLAQAPWWKKGLQQTWRTLQKIVVVQHADHPLPLLTTEQYKFLNQNLHAKIETAIWSLLHHQSIMYQTSLTQMANWIKRYFAQDSSLTSSILTSLTELQKVDIQSPALTANGSLQAFQNYFQSQSSTTHAPPV